MDFREVYYTPSYYLGDWDSRLRLRDFTEAVAELWEPGTEPEAEVSSENHDVFVKEFPETIDQNPEIEEPATNIKTQKTKKEDSKDDLQTSIFDFLIEH